MHTLISSFLKLNKFIYYKFYCTSMFLNFYTSPVCFEFLFWSYSILLLKHCSLFSSKEENRHEDKQKAFAREGALLLV